MSKGAEVWVPRGSVLKRRGRPDVSPSFALGITKPDATNTGVPAGTSLTTYTGDITVTTAGTLIENLDVYGFIRVQAANVTVRNCRVRGRDTGNGYVVGGYTLPSTPSGTPSGDGAYARLFPGWYALIDGQHAGASNLRVERCTVVPDYPAWWMNGVSLHDATIVRCDISGTGDGIEDYGQNIVQGNYVHDLTFFDLDFDHRTSSPPWWSHNDGIQVTGTRGGATTIEGNFFDSKMAGARTGVMSAGGYADLQWGSGVTLSPYAGAINNMLVKNNWMKGGAACLQANGTNSGAGFGGGDTIGEISGNRVSHDQHDYGSGSTYQLRWATGVGVTNYVGTNFWDDDPTVIAWNPAKPGTALTVGFTGGIRIP